MIIDRLNSLVQLTRRGLLQKAKLKAGESWGYGYHDRQEGLLEYYTAIHLLRNQALSTGICISAKELDVIESNIHRILGPECKTGPNDFFHGERSAEWALSNPDCVSYETWSEYLAAQCKKIGIDFKVSVQKCTDVGIDVKVVESQICDIILKPITVEEKVCKIDIDLKPVLQQCEVDFKLYVEPLNCDVDLKTYVHLIECGADVDLIVNQINCGATVDMLVSNIDACYTPVETDIELFELDFNVQVDDSTQCYYTDFTFSLDRDIPHTATFSWDFGSGANIATADTEGPHVIQYTTTGSKTISCTIVYGGEELTKTTNVTVSSCPGQILGSVKTNLGVGMGGCTVRLFPDADLDGVSDGGSPLRSVTTNGSGIFVMANVTPGNYVIVLVQPANHTATSASDTTPDGDLAPSGISPLVIPCTITASKVDQDNNFVQTHV